MRLSIIFFILCFLGFRLVIHKMQQLLSVDILIYIRMLFRCFCQLQFRFVGFCADGVRSMASWTVPRDAIGSFIAFIEAKVSRITAFKNSESQCRLSKGRKYTETNLVFQGEINSLGHKWAYPDNFCFLFPLGQIMLHNLCRWKPSPGRTSVSSMGKSKQFLVYYPCLKLISVLYFVNDCF